MGGFDIRIPKAVALPGILAACYAISQHWKELVLEDASSGHRFANYTDVPFDQLKEVFVYRDSAAATLWDAQGAVDAACNSMIHVIDDGELLTVVVDDVSEPAVGTIRRILSEHPENLLDALFGLLPGGVNDLIASLLTSLFRWHFALTSPVPFRYCPRSDSEWLATEVWYVEIGELLVHSGVASRVYRRILEELVRKTRLSSHDVKLIVSRDGYRIGLQAVAGFESEGK